MALLGQRLETALPIFESHLGPASPAGLGDHRVQGRAILAGAAVLVMARAAAEAAVGQKAWRVEDFAYASPLTLSDDGRRVQMSLDGRRAGRIGFSIGSRAADASDEWTVHATGFLAESAAETERTDLAALRTRLGPARGTDFFQQAVAKLGVEFGPAFRVLGEAQIEGREALVEIRRADESASGQLTDAALLDGALQAIGLVAVALGPAGSLRVVSAIDKAAWPADLSTGFLAHAKLRRDEAHRNGRLVGDVVLLARDGRAIGRIEGVSLDPVAPHIEDDLFYGVEWRESPVAQPAARHLDASGIDRIAAQAIEDLHRRQGMAVYDELLPDLDRVCIAAIAQALRDLRFDARVGRRFRQDDEAAALGIVPDHRRLFGRLLDIFATSGVLAIEGDVFAVVHDLPPAEAAPDPRELLARYGGVDGELRVLLRCADRLAAVLTGRCDPVGLLFPNGSFAEARAIYVESPYARTYNGALTEALRHAIAALPAGAPLRILEIGAGTGGTTRFVLPALPTAATRYVFTDVSPAFFEQAKQDFSSCSGLETALFDLERDPAAQGFALEQFDIVIAANVLHAATDLSRALQRARDLLAPGGMMFVLEGVTPEPWIDLTFGMTRGWWHFSDAAVRPDYPLVSREAWRRLLDEAGLEGHVVAPDDGSSRRSTRQQALIVRAQAAPRTARHHRGDQDRTGARPRARARYARRRRAARADSAVGWRDGRPRASRRPAAGGRRHRRFGGAFASCRTRLHGAPFAISPPSRRRRPPERSGWRHAAPCRRETPRARLRPGRRPCGGLGRVFALEHPDRWGGLVDLPPDADPRAQAAALLSALDASDGEDQSAFRNGARHVPRLRHVSRPDAAPYAPRRDATYLVTGGFGGLGLVVARWLAENGAGRIVLAGRNPPKDEGALRELRNLGSDVVPCRVDIADETRLRDALTGLADATKPLRGIFHAAADLSTAPIEALGRDQVAAMLRPKIEGTVLLERLTRGPTRDFLVLFSSTTRAARRGEFRPLRKRQRIPRRFRTVGGRLHGGASCRSTGERGRSWRRSPTRRAAPMRISASGP